MAMRLKDEIKTQEATAPAEPRQPRQRRVAAPAKATASPAREGKKAVVGYFDPKVSDRIRILSVETRLTVEQLVGMGLNRVLAEFGKKQFPELEPGE